MRAAERAAAAREEAAMEVVTVVARAEATRAEAE